ncbi:hypothetical protein L2Y90_21835 [Burkholderia pyrrocinia]|uniref:hypothetical protein n=1 Tax=Burkholderia pyrrocinia TaxID=60550 RepID=UPI00215AF4A7|nr:hypothetical protein [Burkholderia pyrrocinia]UVE69371.1 hypothetical protein L2Y90_21835 [Burkholderia pyrrocinia]
MKAALNSVAHSARTDNHETAQAAKTPGTKSGTSAVSIRAELAHLPSRAHQAPIKPATDSHVRLHARIQSHAEGIGSTRQASRIDKLGPAPALSTAQKAIRTRVAAEFICPNHMAAIEQASIKGKFAVSFRAAGAATLAALGKGAAAKGHDVIEKTIKPASLTKIYGERAEEVLKKIKEAGIEGYVGHWDENTGELSGIYICAGHNLGDCVQNGVYPIDMNDLDGSLAALKRQPAWDALLFTGDYDMHDMLTFRGSGPPHTPLVGSADERQVIDSINRAVAAVDPNRPFDDIDHNVVRHGPQVNFVSYMMDHETESVRKNGGVPGAVANPGAFPIAMVHKGNWSLLHNAKQLTDFYASVGAHIKNTWNPDGTRGYNPTHDGMVKLGHK